MKRVLKYATGHEIPEGSQYLCTRCSTDITSFHSPMEEDKKNGVEGMQQRFDKLIYHYFLVECDSEGKPPKTKERS